MRFTCAYACMVSMSSCALKRQNSVRVTSSDKVPPGAETHFLSLALHTANELLYFSCIKLNEEYKRFPGYY